MERWEYKVLNFGGVLKTVKADEIQVTLNALGQEGWEAVGGFAADSSAHALVILKRPVGGGAKKSSETWGKW